jgi:uncharacterized membrane protein YbhN (UPF0104 family)
MRRVPLDLSSSKLKRRLFLALKLVVSLLVVAGVAYTAVKALRDVREQGFSLASLDPRWLAVASVAYLIGISPCWNFWHRTLHAMGQSPTLWESFRAYYISHLGKYVPGKAMVVVIRTGWIRSPRTDTTVAAVSVFVETLTMMAVAAFISAAILLVFYRDNLFLLALAPALMLCAGLPTFPPILRWLVRLMRVQQINPAIDQSLQGVTNRLMISGWVSVVLGWPFLGASLWGVLRSIPGVEPSLGEFPLLIVCVALPSVAGFLSFIPGGLGVRELVATALLHVAMQYPLPVAAVSAVMLRLCWLLAEVTILVILYSASRIVESASANAVKRDSQPTEESGI